MNFNKEQDRRCCCANKRALCYLCRRLYWHVRSWKVGIQGDRSYVPSTIWDDHFGGREKIPCGLIPFYNPWYM